MDGVAMTYKELQQSRMAFAFSLNKLLQVKWDAQDIQEVVVIIYNK